MNSVQSLSRGWRRGGWLLGSLALGFHLQGELLASNFQGEKSASSVERPLGEAQDEKKESLSCCPSHCSCRKHIEPSKESLQASGVVEVQSLNSQPTLTPEQKCWMELEVGEPLLSGHNDEEELEVSPIKVWEAPEGSDLKSALEGWAEAVHWKLVWKAHCNYPVVSTVRFEGTLDAALDKLVGAYLHAEQPLRADLYPLQNLMVISNF